MKRRHVLGVLGAAMGSLGGCLGSDEVAPTPTASSTHTPAFDPDAVVERIRIGETRAEIVPHGVVVWNAVEPTRSVDIRVVDASAGETRHEATHHLPGDTAVAISLRAPSDYRITLRVPAVDVQRTISVSERLFDTCNESYTHLSIRRDGRLDERTMTTDLACTTATTKPS